MVARAIGELKLRTKAHNIIVNLQQGWSDGTINHDLVSEFFARTADNFNSRSSAPHVTDDQILIDIRNAVWDDANRFQRRGPTCSASASQIVIFKSYGDLKRLREEITDPSSRRSFESLTGAPFDVVSDTTCAAIARFFNAPDRQKDNLYINPIIDGRAPARFIVWSTRLEELGGLSVSIEPSNALATRFRDKLALSHIVPHMPVFAFISIMSHDELVAQGTHVAYRPTVFDGIDCFFFKHRRDKNYADDNWGRTADFEKIRIGNGAELDGGPEAVSQALPIAENFRCVYVGRPTTEVLFHDDHFTQLQLDAIGMTLDQIATLLQTNFP